MFFVNTPTESSSWAERLTDWSRDTALVARSRRTSAVPILPILLGAFQPPRLHRAGSLRLFSGAENPEFAGILLSPAPTSTFSATIRHALHWRPSNLYLRVMQHKEGAWKDVLVTIKCVSQQILLSGVGGRKAPSSMGKIGTVEVLRLRATSAVSRGKSVRRYAQDDDSVGVWRKTSYKLALKRHPSSCEGSKGNRLRMKRAANWSTLGAARDVVPKVATYWKFRRQRSRSDRKDERNHSGQARHIWQVDDNPVCGLR